MKFIWNEIDNENLMKFRSNSFYLFWKHYGILQKFLSLGVSSFPCLKILTLFVYCILAFQIKVYYICCNQKGKGDVKREYLLYITLSWFGFDIPFDHWNPNCFLMEGQASGPSVHADGFGVGLGASLDSIPDLWLPTSAHWLSTLSLWASVASSGRRVCVPHGTVVRTAHVVPWVQRLAKSSLPHCLLPPLPAPSQAWKWGHLHVSPGRLPPARALAGHCTSLNLCFFLEETEGRAALSGSPLQLSEPQNPRLHSISCLPFQVCDPWLFPLHLSQKPANLSCNFPPSQVSFLPPPQPAHLLFTPTATPENALSLSFWLLPWLTRMYQAKLMGLENLIFPTIKHHSSPGSWDHQQCGFLRRTLNGHAPLSSPLPRHSFRHTLSFGSSCPNSSDQPLIVTSDTIGSSNSANTFLRVSIKVPVKSSYFGFSLNFKIRSLNTFPHL